MQHALIVLSAADRWTRPLALAEVDVAGYDAVVIPGGHGPVEDLYTDADMGRLLTVT